MNKINYNKKIHHKCDETGKSLTYFMIKYIYFIETKQYYILLTHKGRKWHAKLLGKLYLGTT